MFWHHIPVLMPGDVVRLEVLFVFEVGERHCDKPSTVWSAIDKVYQTLVAPMVWFGGGLVSVEETIGSGVPVLTFTIHEAESVEGTTQLVCSPELLVDGFASLSHIPLDLAVT